MQRGKKQSGAKDLINDEAIKDQIRLFGKMTEFKPLVDPSSVDADRLRVDSKVKSERYLAFIREVGETQKAANGKSGSPRKETEWLLQKVRNLMDKITTENKEDVFNEFLSYEITVPPYGCTLISPEFDKQVYEVFEIIFERAVKYAGEDGRLCSVLAELCKRQIDSEKMKDPNNLTIFQLAIMRRLEFSFLKLYPGDEIKQLLSIIRAEGIIRKRHSVNEAMMSVLEHATERNIFIMRFIGAVFNNDIIDCRTIHHFLNQLLKIKNDNKNSSKTQSSVGAMDLFVIELIESTLNGLMIKEEACKIWLDGFISELVDLVCRLNPERDIRDKVFTLRTNFVRLCQGAAQASKTQVGGESAEVKDSVDVDTIKDRIRSLRKMTEFKPLFDPSTVDPTELQVDPNVFSRRYLHFKQDMENNVDNLTSKMGAASIKTQPALKENLNSPQQETEWLLQKVRHLMDKITVDNKEEVFNEFLSYEVTVPQYGCALTSPEFDKQVYEVFEFIFERAVNTDDDEAGNKLRSILADLCKRQIDLEPKQGFVDSTVFQCAIRRRLEHDFIKMLREKDHLPAFSSDQVKETFTLESQARDLNMLRFIGDLFNKSIFNCGLIRHSLNLMDVERRRLPQHLQTKFLFYMGTFIECTMEGMMTGGQYRWLDNFITEIAVIVGDFDIAAFIEEFWMDLVAKLMVLGMRSGDLRMRLG